MNSGWRDCLIYVLLTDKYTAASSIYLCVLRPARRLLRWKTALETECWSSRRGMHNTQRFVQERLRSQRYNRNYGSWSIAGWLVEEFDSNELKLPEYMMRWRLWCICCVGGWVVEKRYRWHQFSEQTLIFLLKLRWYFLSNWSKLRWYSLSDWACACCLMKTALVCLVWLCIEEETACR